MIKIFQCVHSVNEIAFDKKIANAATVHNELILDNKYVLIGRGLYTLREWGYAEGTVGDIVANILKNTGGAMHRDKIVDEVLNQRKVKRTTIILALMNKDKFDRLKGGMYGLHEVN